MAEINGKFLASREQDTIQVVSLITMFDDDRVVVASVCNATRSRRFGRATSFRLTVSRHCARDKHQRNNQQSHSHVLFLRKGVSIPRMCNCPFPSGCGRACPSCRARYGLLNGDLFFYGNGSRSEGVRKQYPASKHNTGRHSQKQNSGEQPCSLTGDHRSLQFFGIDAIDDLEGGSEALRNRQDKRHDPGCARRVHWLAPMCNCLPNASYASSILLPLNLALACGNLLKKASLPQGRAGSILSHSVANEQIAGRLWTCRLYRFVPIRSAEASGQASRENSRICAL